MKAAAFLSIQAVLQSSNAAIIRSPLQILHSGDESRETHLQRHNLAQKPIGPDSLIWRSRHGYAHMPMTKNSTHDLLYCTQISIGTPREDFQVMLDIESPNTFVTSTDCDSCIPGGQRYDHSLSTSFRPNGTRAELNYPWLRVSGNISQDTFHFGNLTIKEQTFVEAKRVMPIRSLWDDLSIIHGMMGLAPSSSNQTTRSLFMTMVSEGVLDQNIFSLRLQEPRELAFGGVTHELFTGNITRIAIANESSGRWQVPTEYVAVGSDPGIRITLDGLTASFTTASAFMFLPDRLVERLLHDLEFEDIIFMPPSINCHRRPYLPDITFNLAAHNLTLTPYDYTLEWPREGAAPRCVSAILPALGLPPDRTNEVILGASFLRAFYTVFDWDLKTVGCKCTQQLKSTRNVLTAL